MRKSLAKSRPVSETSNDTCPPSLACAKDGEIERTKRARDVITFVRIIFLKKLGFVASNEEILLKGSLKGFDFSTFGK